MCERSYYHDRICFLVTAQSSSYSSMPFVVLITNCQARNGPSKGCGGLGLLRGRRMVGFMLTCPPYRWCKSQTIRSSSRVFVGYAEWYSKDKPQFSLAESICTSLPRRSSTFADRGNSRWTLNDYKSNVQVTPFHLHDIKLVTEISNQLSHE